MLIAATVTVGTMLFPLFLIVLACFLLRYRGGAPLLRLRTKSLPAVLLSVVASLISLFFLWCLVGRVQFWRVSRLPYTAYFLSWAIYFQYLRAAAVHRHDPSEEAANRG
jgi:amino acid transporter